MKPRFTYLAIFFTFLSTLNIFAQGNNCTGDIQPMMTCPTDLTVCENEQTVSPMITLNSNLPDLEYGIVDLSQTSNAGTAPGPPVVGFDDDGIFAPADFGLLPGNQFEIIPTAYDLTLIQNTLDDFLKNSFFFVPCCDLDPNSFCDTLNMVGIFCGSDVTSLQQMLELQQGNSNTTYSIDEFLLELDALNAELANVPSACGGGNEICIAYGNACTYSIENISPVVNITTPHTMSETIAASNLITSNTLITTGLVILYELANSIELLPGFEVENGAEFTADPNSGACN